MPKVRTSVLLITIDALRADHVSALGYPRATTPNIDRLAEQGVLYSSAFANGPTTPFSFPSILASIYPFQIDGIGLPKGKFRTTAEVFEAGGYRTAGFSPNDFISRPYNYHRGFGTFMDLQNWATAQDKIRRRVTGTVRKWPTLHRFVRTVNNQLLGKALAFTRWDAEGVLSQAARWLHERDRGASFFLWCHLNDAHHPWKPRPSYLKRVGAEFVSPKRAKELVNKLLSNPDDIWSSITPEEMLAVIDLYDAAIMYADEKIGEFITAEVNLDTTLVIVTSDHGEEFGEHGGFHRIKPYHEMLHVPLIMAGSNLPRGIVIDQQVSLIDLAPTIIELCGLPRVEDLQGTSLLPLINGSGEDRAIISSYDRRLVDGDSAPEGEVFIIQEDGWKLIVRESGDELYNLGSDPRELNSLVQRESKTARDLKRKLGRHISRFAGNKVVIEEPELDEIIRERLRGLGYLD